MNISAKRFHKASLLLVAMLIATLGLVLGTANAAKADPPCSPGPNCYSVTYSYGTWLGIRAAIPRNTTSISFSNSLYAAHINSETWANLSGTDNFVEIGLRNGYDGVNNAQGACNCVAYNQFWAYHNAGVQYTTVIAHTSPQPILDNYEIARKPNATGQFSTFMNGIDRGSTPNLGSWTIDRADIGGEFQHTSCEVAYGWASTFNMVSSVRNFSYAWNAPSWSAQVINTGCHFNGHIDTTPGNTPGNWAWNMNI